MAQNEKFTIRGVNINANGNLTAPATIVGAGGSVSLPLGAGYFGYGAANDAASVKSLMQGLAAIGSSANLDVTGGGFTSSTVTYLVDWSSILPGITELDVTLYDAVTNGSVGFQNAFPDGSGFDSGQMTFSGIAAAVVAHGVYATDQYGNAYTSYSPEPPYYETPFSGTTDFLVELKGALANYNAAAFTITGTGWSIVAVQDGIPASTTHGILF